MDAQLCIEGTGNDLLTVEICGRALRTGAAAGLSALSRATLYTARGRAHTARGEFASAMADFDAALRLNPASASAYNYRGLARHGRGRFELAVVDYTRAIELFPHYAEAYRNRGTSYFFLGDTARSIADCSQAIALNPADPESFARRGLARYRQGRFAQAARDFAHLESMQFPYRYLPIWKYLALARAQRDARASLAEVAAQLDADEWPRPVIAAYLDMGTAQEALAAARATDPERRAARLSEAQFYLGELQSLRGDRTGAAAWFRDTVAAGFAQSVEHQMAQAALQREPPWP